MSSMPYTALRLQSLLRESGLTQKEISKRAGISPVSLCRYVKGTRTPSSTSVRRLAEAFHTTADDILGNTPEQQDTLADYYAVLHIISRCAGNWGPEQRAALVTALFQPSPAAEVHPKTPFTDLTKASIPCASS